MKVKRGKRIALLRGKPHKPSGPNQHRSMDFVHDQTHDGHEFHILAVIDPSRRESVCLESNSCCQAGARYRCWMRLPGASVGPEP